MRLRKPGIAIALALPFFLALGTARAMAQTNYDRPGGDYTSAKLTSGDPEDCALMCERDRRCRAWNFRYPAPNAEDVDRPSVAVCWLKSTVPPRVPSPASVSGVRGAGVIELRNSAIETSIDRPGGDYHSFVLPASPTGDACKATCEGDDKCRAWTYARPGYAGPAAHCFLKNQVKPPRRRPGMISGVVR
jgi:PAN domain